MWPGVSIFSFKIRELKSALSLIHYSVTKLEYALIARGETIAEQNDAVRILEI